MLTFEYEPDGVLEVNFDASGRNDLLAIIARIALGDHERIATPSWGGDNLSEDFPNPNLKPIHQVTFQFVGDSPTE